jgi:hypothetical protein
MRPTPHDLVNPVETPAGLIVPSRSMESLVKAEATKQRILDNKTKFFSQFSLNSLVFGAREKPVGTPQASILYEASEKSFIDAIIIQARIDQMKQIWGKASNGKSKQVGFKVVHERHDDKDFKGSKLIDERCREMEDVLSDPSPEEYAGVFTDGSGQPYRFYPEGLRPHQRLKELMGILTRSELIIDRKVIRRYKRADGKGYSCFHWIPGDSIKNVDETLKLWAYKNEPTKKVQQHTIDRMSAACGFDIAQASFVQMIDGMIVNAYTDKEISVHITNPSDRLNRWGYGTSRLEMSLDVTTVLLFAWNYNREMFKTNYPEQVLTVAGDYDKEGLAAFKQQILGEAGGVGNNWRLPVIPAGDPNMFKIESIKLRDTPKDMLFDTLIRLLLMVKCSAYGAHASILNLGIDSGQSGGSMFGHDNSYEIESSDERWLKPSIQDNCEWLTDAIIKPRYDDLKLVVVNLEPENEKEAIDIRGARVSKYLTRNEARMEEDMEPIGDPDDPENPWNFPCDVPIPNYLNTFQMLNQPQDQGDGQDGPPDTQKSAVDGSVLRKARRPKGDGAPPVKFLQITLED